MDASKSSFVIGTTRDMTITALTTATNRTFEGYFLPIEHTVEGFASFCRVHHLDLARSVVLRNTTGDLAGVTMLGIREKRGWCGGFGIVPEFRRQGLAALLFEGLLTAAREANLDTLQLEVLAQNQPAISVYLRGGMQIRREVITWIGEAASILPRLKPATVPVSACSLSDTLRWAAHIHSLTPFPLPTWQREFSMLYLKPDVYGLVSSTEQGNAALIYGYNPQNGVLRIEDLAFDNTSIAHALLAQAIVNGETIHRRSGDTTPVRLFLLNEPMDTRLNDLVSSLGLQIAHRQQEMIIDLSS